MVLHQQVHDALLHHCAQPLPQFTAHIAPHFFPQRLEGPLGHAQRAGKILVHGRQHGFVDFLDRDVERYRLTRQVLHPVVVGEFQVDGETLSGLLAHDRLLEALDHHPGTDHKRDILGTAAFEGLAVDLADKTDRDAIFLAGLTLHGVPGRALPAQLLEHGIHIGIGHFGDIALHRSTRQFREHHFGHDLELGRISETVAFFLQFDSRLTGGLEVFLHSGLLEG